MLSRAVVTLDVVITQIATEVVLNRMHGIAGHE